jgi:hypothetical protein
MPELLPFAGVKVERVRVARYRSSFDMAALLQSARRQYRCQDHIRELIAWLRSKGVVSRTPLHALRKEFGSQIKARYGLTAAQEMLRHDIAVTAAHYVENKRRSVLGFGHLLKGERMIVPIDKAAVSRDQQNKSRA